MKIKNKNIGFYFFAFSLFLYSCSLTEPPNNSNINLQVEDVSCTEAWLKLETQNISLPVKITLTNNNEVEQIIKLSKPDTTIYIDSLLPDKTYSFQISGIGDPVSSIRSNKVSVTTLDTTSHNFTWQTFTFGGEAGSSVLYDVTIINENNIWVVGEIYLKDSTGQPDPEVYNAVHWDGETWQVKRITIEFRGNQVTAPLEGIFAFSGNDIWVVGSLPIHGNGESWIVYDVRTTTDPSLSLSKAWGTDSNNMYFGGRSGSIAHYQNGQWSKIESGTETFIGDIWGITDNYETTVYCVVSSFFVPGDKKVLRIKNNQVDSVSWNMDRQLNGIWTNNEKYLYVCGGGVFNNKQGYWYEAVLPSITTNTIRGNGLNDIFVAGDFGLVAHYNGVSWHIYKNIFDAGYSNIAVNGNTTAIVGQRNGYGIITIGKRN